MSFFSPGGGLGKEHPVPMEYEAERAPESKNSAGAENCFLSRLNIA